MWLMAGIMACYCIYAILFAEEIPVHGGLGWDGELYGSIIKHFNDAVFHKQLEQYTIGRTLPLYIIFHSLQFLNLDLTDHNIIILYQIMNGFLIVGSVFLWVMIADHLILSKTGIWIGFISLFINFAILKNSFYYPVGTDPFTFFLGCLLLLLFLKRKFAAILILSVLGAFVSPTMIFFGLLLFMFKSQEIKFEEAKYKLNYIFAILTCLLILGGIIYSNYFLHFVLPNEDVAPVGSLFLFDIFSLMVLLFITLSELFNNNNIYDVIKIRSAIIIPKLIIAAGVYLLIQYIYQKLGKPNYIEGYKTSYYLKYMMKICIAKPFVSIVSAVIWFGPALIITLINWKGFIKVIYKYGYGLFFAIILGFLLLFLDTESRHSILFYPFIIAFSIKAIDGKKINKYFIFAFVALSLLFSKIWFSINPIPADPGNLWEFPMQKYFMNSGPWIANQPYAIHGIAVLCVFILIFIFFYKNSGTKKTEIAI